MRSLGEETHRVLTLASVIGRDFDLDLLERVAEIDADQLMDLCDGAVEAQVLRERDRGAGYTFAHALIERTLYDNVSANRRARAHRAIAEALEVLTHGEPGPQVGELAYHWAQATRPRTLARRSPMPGRPAPGHSPPSLPLRPCVGTARRSRCSMARCPADDGR